jgi:hypothetical protein
MFTKQFPSDAVNWVVQENLKFPREYAARLFFNLAVNDWRHVAAAQRKPQQICATVDFSFALDRFWSRAPGRQDQARLEAASRGRRIGPVGQMLCSASAPRISPSRGGSNLILARGWIGLGGFSLCTSGDAEPGHPYRR